MEAPPSNRLLKYAMYIMYCGDMEGLGHSLDWKLGLYLSTLACLSNSSISVPK
jgi:hypothetical protein